MFLRRFRLVAIMLAVVALPVGLAYAMGFQLGESKEQLKLKYDVSVTDHGTGRISVVLTIVDPGKLKPIDSVDLFIPAKVKNGHGGRYADLSVALATRGEGGNQVVRAHMLRELANRAVIQLKTSSFDGKQEALTWYFHSIPIADYLNTEE